MLGLLRHLFLLSEDMVIFLSALIGAIGGIQGYFLIDTLVVASYVAGVTEKGIGRLKMPPRLLSIIIWFVFLITLLASILSFIVPVTVLAWLIAPLSLSQESRTILVRVWIIAFLVGLGLLRLIRERTRKRKRSS